MAEARNQSGNGADEQERRASAGGQQRPLADTGRQLQSDAQRLLSHADQARNELQGYLTQSVRERPVATLATAAGVGYLLGGGLSSRLTVLMVGIATRLAMAVAAREMGSWATEGAGAGAHPQPSPTRH